MKVNKEKQKSDLEQISKRFQSSELFLKLEIVNCLKGGIGSNRKRERYGEML